MRAPISRLIGIAATALAISECLTVGVGADSSKYAYTVIADLPNCNNIYAPALNNSGEVAFDATCGSPVGPSSGGVVVRRGQGAQLTDIYTWAAGSSSPVPEGPVSINDDGFVAFGVSAHDRILVGNGGSLTTIVDTVTAPQYRSVASPSIDNGGDVAFMADTDSSQGYDSIIIASSGSFVNVAAPGKQSSVGPLVSAVEPSLNDNGLVTLTGQGAATYGVFTGNGGPLTAVSYGQSESSFNSINDTGRVALLGLQGSTYAVLTRIDQSQPPTVIATQSASGYAQFFQSAINNHDQVAFSAQLASGEQGIFTGPDPVADVVVKTGETIPTLGTVVTVAFSKEGINDTGQIAILVQYDADDGGPLHRAIVRVDPLASTTTTLTVSPTTAAFGQAVTLNAAVESASGVPTGEVTFSDNGLSVATALLNGGVAVVQTSGLSVGTHALSGSYEGNDDFVGSQSVPVSATITKAQTMTTLTSSPNPSLKRQSVIFSVHVSPVAPGSGTPNGQVRILKGKKVFATINLSNGSGSLTVSFSQPGQQTFTAAYGGSASFLGSSSPPYTHTVRP